MHDLVESLVSLVVLKVEKSYLPTLRSNSSVKEVEDPDTVIEPLTYPSEPSELVITGKSVMDTIKHIIKGRFKFKFTTLL